MSPVPNELFWRAEKISVHRERRAARRAALGLNGPETSESTNSRKNERTTRQRADSKGSNNDRGLLEVTSPVNDSRPLSPRSSPHPSPRSSSRSTLTLQQRMFMFEEPKTEGECGAESFRFRQDVVVQSHFALGKMLSFIYG